MSSGWVKTDKEARERDIVAIRQLKRAKIECAGMPQHYQDSVWRMHRFLSDAERRRISKLADRHGVNL